MRVQIVTVPGSRDVHGYLVWCPGCGAPHLIPATELMGGTTELPTFPRAYSFVSFAFWPNECGQAQQYRRCAFIIRNGTISYLPQSNHALRNLTRELPRWPFAVAMPSGQ